MYCIIVNSRFTHACCSMEAQNVKTWLSTPGVHASSAAMSIGFVERLHSPPPERDDRLREAGASQLFWRDARLCFLHLSTVGTLGMFRSRWCVCVCFRSNQIFLCSTNCWRCTTTRESMTINVNAASQQANRVKKCQEVFSKESPSIWRCWHCPAHLGAFPSRRTRRIPRSCVFVHRAFAGTGTIDAW